MRRRGSVGEFPWRPVPGLHCGGESRRGENQAAGRLSNNRPSRRKEYPEGDPREVEARRRADAPRRSPSPPAREANPARTVRCRRRDRSGGSASSLSTGPTPTLEERCNRQPLPRTSSLGPPGASSSRAHRPGRARRGESSVAWMSFPACRSPLASAAEMNITGERRFIMLQGSAAALPRAGIRNHSLRALDRRRPVPQGAIPQNQSRRRWRASLCG